MAEREMTLDHSQGTAGNCRICEKHLGKYIFLQGSSEDERTKQYSPVKLREQKNPQHSAAQ